MEKKESNHALRYSIRIAGSVTSLSLRRNLVALWLALNSDVSFDKVIGTNPGIKGSLNGQILNFIYKCLGKWEGNTGKGFSDFVSDMMIADILEDDDFKKYREISQYI